MASASTFDQFDFSFDPTLDPYGFAGSDPQSMDDVPGADPGVFLPNTEGRTEFLPPDPARVPQIDAAVRRDTPEYAARPAQERIAELLNQMAPHRQVLLGVLRTCAQARPMHEVTAAVDELRAHKFSVYTPANICTMLEAAGALSRLDADGGDYAAHAPAPRIVVEDGQEFYVPGEPPEIWWRTTEAGAEALDQNDPAARLAERLAADAGLERIYKRVLVLAARPQGATMAQLSAAVDADPLIAEPRRFFVQHFAEVLERVEALAWQGDAWHATEQGEAALAGVLAEVVDDYSATADAEPATIETQGINW